MSSVDQHLSNAHRAILLVAKTHVSGQTPCDLPELLRSASPEDLVRVAQNNHLHALVGRVLIRNADLRDALPRDLVLYFKAMYEANQARSKQARFQLEQIADAFSSVKIPCVVLKGGGDLLDPLHVDPHIRFIGDLDILVPQELAEAAQQVLSEIGAEAVPFVPTASNPQFNQRGIRRTPHHLPKILHEEWALPIELHLEIGRSPANQMLPSKKVFSRARPTGPGDLCVMSTEDRACHLIAHAKHHGGEFDLRSWVDWTALRGKCDLTQVRERLAEFDLSEVLEDFETMSGFLSHPNEDASEATNSTVSDRALRQFGSTRKRKIRYIPLLVSSKARALAKSPEYRRYLLSSTFSLSWWKTVWATHRAKIRNQR